MLLFLFCAISLAAWGGTYWLISGEMQRAVDQRLSDRMEATLAALEAGETPPAPTEGQYAGAADDTWPSGFVAVETSSREEPDYRYLVFETAQGRLAVGENVERQEELQQILSGGMQLALLATLCLTTLAGVWLAINGQRRLRVINEGLAEVGRGNLATRIQVKGNDDLSLLADRINLTAKRLDHAMQQMRVQSSNIAHDLRTPLARLRAQIETNLDALTERGEAVSAEALEADLEQIDQVTEIFDALLRLARIESGAGRESFEPVEMRSILEAAVETFEPVVSEAGHALVVENSDASIVSGDESLLIQLVANLIQNALRYGQEGQAITLACHGTVLSVTDEGQGIPLAHRKRVLQPFYQGEAARSGEGSGLGLSLVRAIAELHGAELYFSDGPNGRGLKVSVPFPKTTKL
ncbi:MAG: HAMP domain-containing histidine kinase [Rhodobacteraceae bacterium]|nr:HAMP domain-containing histidine kinase [Paracoccaceae bacterium]